MRSPNGVETKAVSKETANFFFPSRYSTWVITPIQEEACVGRGKKFSVPLDKVDLIVYIYNTNNGDNLMARKPTLKDKQSAIKMGLKIYGRKTK